MNKPSRPGGLLLASVLCLRCGALPSEPLHSPDNPPSTAPSAPAPPQQVVLITVDTLRADMVQCEGDEPPLTPHICALWHSGRRYTRAISPAPATLPALTAIFTHSQVANEEPTTLVAHYDALPTLAEQLKEQGLETAAFTDHHGLGNSVAVPVFPPSVIQRGFTVFENVGVDRNSLGAEQVTDAAIAWLKPREQAPYFLWTHYFDPHFNYRPDPAMAAAQGYRPEDCGRVTNGMDITEIRELTDQFTEKELSCLKALYRAEVSATDQAIGRLLAALPTSPAPRILFASDHGEEFRERSRIGHEWTVYNELIHVPLIVSGPGVTPGEEPRVVSTLEIHSLARGLPAALTGEAYSRANHYYGKTPDISKVRQRANEHTLVTDTEKVILHPDGRVEQFDLLRDPNEQQPASQPGPLLDRLRAKMAERTVSSATPSASAAARDRAEKERLQQLGYVE